MTDTGGAVLVTTLRHVGGETVEGRYPLLIPTMTDPQKFGGAVTYARRYSLLAILCCAADDDDAQDARTPRQVPARRQESSEGVREPQRPQNGQNEAPRPLFAQPDTDAPPASDKQHKFVRALAAEKGLSDDALHALAGRETLGGISVRDMSTLIDQVKAVSPEEIAAAGRVAPEQPRYGAGMSWNEFWLAGRANGISSREALEQALGSPLGAASPTDALAMLRELRGPDFVTPQPAHRLAVPVQDR